MEIVPVDNLPLLTAVHEVHSVGKDLIEKLQTIAVTEAQIATVDAIRIVIETQAEMINTEAESWDIVHS